MFRKTFLGCLGVIAAAVVVVVIVLLIGAVGQSGGSQRAATIKEGGVAETVTPVAPTAIAKIGTPIQGGNWAYMVTKTARQKEVVWSDFGNKSVAKGIWQIVHLKLTNVGKETYGINTWDFEVHDSQGIKYKTSYESTSYSNSEKLSAPMDQYPPNVGAEIGLLFDLDPAARGLKLYLVQSQSYIDLE